MNNYRVTIDVQMDSDKTAYAFAATLSKTMEITAGTAIDVSDADEPHVILGKTTIVNAYSFEPN